MRNKKILTVVRWPLGGIRTYMRYVYQNFDSEWQITILAADVQESSALREDAKLLGAELILAPASPLGFLWTVFRILAQRRHDIIQSQGFISAITACLANLFFRKPHVLTVHGVLEDRLLQGLRGHLKRLVTNWAICSVDVVYAVSEDILAHVQKQVPCLARSKVKQVAIMNGIDPNIFLEPRAPGEFRRRNDLGSDLFLFGFLGRFMPQKGFDRIIEALVHLEKISVPCEYCLLAIGSGDYQSHYESLAKEKGVFHRIVFLPFQQDVSSIYHDLDAVVMPSRWEAFGLLASEALVSGVPLITSDCLGLREVVRHTPAIVVPDGDPQGLAHAMLNLLNFNYKQIFKEYSGEAAIRFDVLNTSNSLMLLLTELLELKKRRCCQ
jgi:glycosyltransferase involved in cell wall biosynthesis